MRRYILYFSIVFTALLGHGLVLAATNNGVGDFASSMIEPVGVLSNFISTAAIIIGVGCIFGAFLRYSQYRINPVAAPLSSVLILLILGLLLLGLPFLDLLLGNNIAFLHQK